MISSPEAFLLLSVSDVALAGPGLNPDTGVLHLEGVSIQHPQSTRSEDRDVYLVLRLNAFEMPIDHACVVTRTDEPKARTYRFSETHSDPSELMLSVRGPFVEGDALVDTLDALENILEQYAAEFRRVADGVVAVEPLTAGQTTAIRGAVNGNKDLRGHLVMINEDTGEIIGEIEDRFRIKEDAAMREAGHENDPVVIQIPDDYTRESDKHALEVFATVIPPDQRNWISTSANIVSQAISMTTTLLITTITTGASLYVNHTSPSPHHPASRAATSGSTTPNDKAPPGAALHTSGGPPPLPPRALVFLTSESTRKGLSTVHALSGQAVKVSTKTVGLIDQMIRRAMGAKPKRQKYFATGIPASGSNPNLLATDAANAQEKRQRTPSPTSSSRSAELAPPPYNSASSEKGGAYPPEKPALPPRRTPSPALPLKSSTPGLSGKNETPISVPYEQYQPRASQPQRPGVPPQLPERKLETKDHILISADLILSTIDDSARRMLDAGTVQIGRVVGHKYGPQAAESSLYMAGTARNVGLVYIDMSGIGRRALLKRAGKTFLKARLSSNDPNAYPPPGQAPAPAPRK